MRCISEGSTKQKLSINMFKEIYIKFWMYHEPSVKVDYVFLSQARPYGLYEIITATCLSSLVKRINI